MKKILILTGSYGHGHNTAAQNLKQYWEQEKYDVRILDLVDFAGIVARGAKKFSTTASEKIPYIWEKTFDLFDSHLARDLMFSIRPIVYQTRFNNFIKSFGADAIVVTFPFWLWFLNKYFKHNPKSFKVGIVVTDAINIHQTWYLEEKWVDKWFVIDEYSKQSILKKFNLGVDKIEVSFFPLLEEKFKNKSHISGKNILLMLSYAIDEDYVWGLVESLLSLDEINLAIVKGRAPDFFEELKEEFQTTKKIHFYDFLPLFEEFGKKDRIYIGKPGGATMSEAIATDTPMIIPAYYPGQEEGNLKLLEMTETGFYIPDPALTYAFIKYGNWDKLLPNFKKIKKSDSLEIIDEALCK